MSNQPKLCLNMIVRDEAHVIKETLESVANYIDYYVISDTGSIDDTVKIIKNYFETRGIKGEIFHDEWKDFGHNRSLALQHCKDENGVPKTEYIWVIDADDIVVGTLELPKLKNDSYNLIYGKDFTYERTQIFKNTSEFNWKYVGILHEYPDCDKNNYSKVTIKGNYYIDSRRLGSRSNDPNKYKNDALKFEEYLKEHPNSERDIFYCGQSWFDHGNMDKAYYYYNKRAEMGGWYEEVFYSLYKIGMILIRQDKPEHEIETHFYKTFKKFPHRSECLYELAHYFNIKGEFEKSYKYSKQGINIPYPRNEKLFIFRDIYEYKLIDEHSISSFYTGHYNESYYYCKKLLDMSNLSKDMVKRVKTNMNFAKRNLTKDSICVIYTGYSFIDDRSEIFKVIDGINGLHQVYLVGENINFESVNKKINDENIIVLDKNSYFLFASKNKIDLLIVFKDLSYYYDNIISKITSEKSILWQIDRSFRVYVPNGIKVEINNPQKISEIISNINKIVCDESIKSSIKKHFLINDELFFTNSDKNDSIITVLDNNNNNKSKNNSLVEKNIEKFGYNYSSTFLFPSHLDIIYRKDNINEWESMVLNNSLQKLSKVLPNNPEVIYHFIKLTEKLNKPKLIDNYLEKIEQLCKNKNFLFFKNILEITKARILFKREKFEECFYKLRTTLNSDLIGDDMRIEAEKLKDNCIDKIKSKFLEYPKSIINDINYLKVNSEKPKIFFSMTTCKRFDLFTKTINSFINCCTDLKMISKWICVDDNSSNIDRKAMKERYPFFEFIFKKPEEKGHCRSMNIIQNKFISDKGDYLIHMEDDFHFFEKRNYIGESLAIFKENKNIGQVLFNRNYSEVGRNELYIWGGILRHTTFEEKRIRFIEHEHYKNNSKEYEYFLKNSKGSNCAYWPHFSFRPSMIKRSVYEQIGQFYNNGHFEMEYAFEYYERGFRTVFLDTISCIHIGKKTWEKDVKNAYNLNNEVQFFQKDSSLNKYVVSNNNNLDQWRDFKKKTLNFNHSFVRKCIESVMTISKIDVNKFTNFKYKKSAIVQILTHINIWRESSKSCLVIEDSVSFCDNFDSLLDLVIKNKDDNYELLVVGETDRLLTDGSLKLKKFDKNKNEQICGYIITEKGINKFLEYISNNKIDTPLYEVLPSVLKTHCFEEPLITSDKKYKYDIESKEINGYLSYRGLDSFGEDMKYFNDMEVNELKDICDNDSNSLAFNSLGWIKKKVKDSENLYPFNPTTDTFDYYLYIKKD